MISISTTINRLTKLFVSPRPKNVFLDGHKIPSNRYKYIDVPVHAKNIIKAMHSVYFGRVTVPNTPLTSTFSIRADFPLYDTHVSEIVNRRRQARRDAGTDKDYEDCDREDAEYEASKGRRINLGSGPGFISCKYTVICEGVDILTVWEMSNTRNGGTNIGTTYGLTFFEDAAVFKKFADNYVGILLDLQEEFERQCAAKTENEQRIAAEQKFQQQKAAKEKRAADILAAYQSVLQKLDGV